METLLYVSSSIPALWYLTTDPTLNPVNAFPSALAVAVPLETVILTAEIPLGILNVSKTLLAEKLPPDIDLIFCVLYAVAIPIVLETSSDPSISICSPLWKVPDVCTTLIDVPEPASIEYPLAPLFLPLI